MKNLANTTEQTETQELANIPTTGFKTENTETACERRMVQFNSQAHFKLSAFSVEQLLFGWEHINTSYHPDVVAYATVLHRLAHIALYADKTENVPVGVMLEYKHVLILRKFLEARMAHCEAELNTFEEEMKVWNEKVNNRIESYQQSKEDSENHFRHSKPTTKFNNTTYVAQKNLLLELRLWLCGDIID